MGSQEKNKSSYYESGSNKVAEVTAVTLKKLEQRRKLTAPSERLVICLVGLPGRGKSFIARKLQTFLNWRGIKCEVFNVGKYRRQVQADVSNTIPESPSETDHSVVDNKNIKRQTVGACDANFFDSNNPQAKALREKSAKLALDDMLKWLDNVDGELDSPKEGRGMHRQQSGLKAQTDIRSRLAIFDATNSTEARRKWVLEECTSPAKRGDKTTGVIFLESVCDDQELLDENFRFKVQNSPDFEGMTEEEAIADLRTRVVKYEAQYETIKDDKQSYIKIFNLSSKLMVNHIYGRIAKVIVPCLMSWNIGSRPIYLCRAGDTVSKTDEVPFELGGGEKKRISRGDILGEKGLQFRDRLEQFIQKEGIEYTKKTNNALNEAMNTGTSISGLATALDSIADTIPFACHIMTSTMPRAVETASWESLPFRKYELPNLNPLYKGDFSGMELDEIAKEHPEWYSVLEEDPFHTRFPGGECYKDLIHRLETCIIDMEQQMNMTCVVSHVSVLQVLIAYFRRTPIDKCSSIEVPMHTVIKFTPVTGGGWTESQHELGPIDDDHDTWTASSDEEGGSGLSTPIWGDHIKKTSSDDPTFFCCPR
jgi:6-phosphofructo-2-kinase/fructose-2,6-biphosphatase 2